LIAIAILAPVCAAAAPGPAPARTQAVGGPLIGQTALEFVGRSDQEQAALTHYGYLTHVAGLPDALLFSSATTRSEATARFTYMANTTLDTRHELGNLIVTAATGTLMIYFQARPAGDFNRPASFALGTPIATYAIRYHNVLNVQAPNAGIATAVAELTQQRVGLFPLQGLQILGFPGLRLRLSATGEGTRSQTQPLRSSFVLAGELVVAGG
jgi:hypothetical protein